MAAARMRLLYPGISRMYVRRFNARAEPPKGSPGRPSTAQGNVDERDPFDGRIADLENLEDQGRGLLGRTDTRRDAGARESQGDDVALQTSRGRRVVRAVSAEIGKRSPAFRMQVIGARCPVHEPEASRVGADLVPDVVVDE